MSKAYTLEVRRENWSETRVFEEAAPEALEDNEIILQIDRQALTANNITYAATGDSLGYWGFFPAEEGWGRIPAMSWADVVASNHPEIKVGERVWGSFPLSTHLKVVAGNVTPNSFTDVSPHRTEFPPVYAQIDRASGYPFYEETREDQDILLRGLFITSWLIDDFIDVNSAFGAQTCIITSASSKTSIALAYCLSKRGGREVIGLTSPRNAEFCNSLNCYDKIITYDDVNSLEKDKSVMIIDMAGSQSLLEKLHNLYGGQLKYSCRVGQTHYHDHEEENNLPGPQPIHFSAPLHFQARAEEIGIEAIMMGPVEPYIEFRKFCDSWLEMIRHYGPEAATAAYQKVLAGGANPSKGQIISMHRKT